MADGFYNLDQRMVGAWIFEYFCVRNGKTFSNAIINSKYVGYPKYCFANAAFFMKTAKLRYFEGYCMSSKIEFPFHHAWCVDANDQVIEVTLAPIMKDWDIKDYSYLGVEVSKTDYKKQTSKNNTSVFDTGHGRNIKYILQIDPGIKQLMSNEIQQLVESF
jgi:hypothetical protein